MASNTSLRPALDAEQVRIKLEGFGELNLYVDTRSGGQSTLLVHSVNAAASAYEVKPLFESIRTHRNVYALELPGFGQSERPDTRYDTVLFRRAITEALAQLGLTQVDVVAMSLSSEFAAAAATEPDSPIRSLCLLSPTGMGHRNPPTAVGDSVFSISRLPLFGKSLYRALTTRPSIRLFLSQAFVGPLPGDMVEYAYETCRQPGARYAPYYFLSFSLFDRKAVEAIYSRVRQPVLVLYDGDPNVSFEKLDALLSQHPNWRAMRISPTMGLPHWDQPEQTSQALTDFWGELNR